MDRDKIRTNAITTKPHANGYGFTGPPMTFTIRPALASDAVAVGHLARQFAEYLRSLGDPTDFQMTAEAYLRDGFGARPAFRGLVAETQGQVIGYLLHHFGYNCDGAWVNLHIVDLYVDEPARRQGVGRALMQAAAGIARESNCREMVWSVYRANETAIGFYEQLGARRITEIFFMELAPDVL